jgi:SagB-type dehydrogenase family enzyme
MRQVIRKIRLGGYVSLTAVFLILSLPRGLFGQEQKNIKLLQPRTSAGKPLMQALKERRSQRNFSSKEIPLQIVSDLLWAACGVNRPESNMRTNPTAMNFQEIELYLTNKDGLYRYDAVKNELIMVFAQDIRALTGKQDFVAGAALNLIYVADFSKMKGQDERSKELWSAMDVGFVSQNVYLFCASEGLATVVRGWFEREELQKKMGLGSDKRVILCQSVGYPQQ